MPQKSAASYSETRISLDSVHYANILSFPTKTILCFSSLSRSFGTCSWIQTHIGSRWLSCLLLMKVTRVGWWRLIRLSKERYRKLIRRKGKRSIWEVWRVTRKKMRWRRMRRIPGEWRVRLYRIFTCRRSLSAVDNHVCRPTPRKRSRKGMKVPSTT